MIGHQNGLKDRMLLEINRVAEVEHVFKPMLENTLKKTILNQDPSVAHLTQGCPTYWELWQLNFNDQFFTMATFVRLASVMETNFRWLYNEK